MTKPKAVLAMTSKEIREHAIAARGLAERGIILAPVDFSDHSEAALIQAAKFAELIPATLIALHVVHEPGEMPGRGPREQSLRWTQCVSTAHSRPSSARPLQDQPFS